jgi:hypothetical protein
MTLFKDSSNTLPSKSPIPDIVSLSLLTITEGVLYHITHRVYDSCKKRVQYRDEGRIIIINNGSLVNVPLRNEE